MIKFAEITVVLLDGSILAFKNETITNVAKQCLRHPLANKNPLLLKVGEEYKLYFNTSVFVSWIEQEIDLEELLAHVKVDNLVRNTEAIFFKDCEVEENSLWLQRNSVCILVDSDSFVSVILDDRFKSIN